MVGDHGRTGLDLDEGAEDLLAHVLRHPAAAVGHSHLDRLRRAGRGDRHAGADRRIAQRVLDQVRQRAAEEVVVRVDLHLVERDAEGDRPIPSAQIELGGDVGDHLLEVERHRPGRELPLVGLADVEEVHDHPRQLARLRADLRRRLVGERREPA